MRAKKMIITAHNVSWAVPVGRDESAFDALLAAMEAAAIEISEVADDDFRDCYLSIVRFFVRTGSARAYLFFEV